MASPKRRAFPLVPRHRMTGVAYGTQRSLRRGQGAEIAGSRPYRPGDRLAWIDWSASARLSNVQDDDIFVVREFYAEIAPRVVIVVDRRPSMGLYPPDLPWLSKPEVLREAITAIVASAHAARAYVGYLDFSEGLGRAAATPHWIAPHRQSARQIVNRLTVAFDAPSNGLELAIDYLLGLRRDVPAGSFVFLVSDFLSPPPDHVLSQARARRWDLVPVIVQDPVWEQSFPLMKGLVVPFTDPETGKTKAVRLSAREARERQSANAVRLSDLIHKFHRLQFDPVLLDTSEPYAIDLAFINWATKRRLTRGQARA